MRKILAVTAVLAFMMCGGLPSRAQEATSETIANANAAKEAHGQPDRPLHAYRLDFSVNEMEDGKKINTRQYSMNSRSGDVRRAAMPAQRGLPHSVSPGQGRPPAALARSRPHPADDAVRASRMDRANTLAAVTELSATGSAPETGERDQHAHQKIPASVVQCVCQQADLAVARELERAG